MLPPPKGDPLGISAVELEGTVLPGNSCVATLPAAHGSLTKTGSDSGVTNQDDEVDISSPPKVTNCCRDISHDVKQSEAVNRNLVELPVSRLKGEPMLSANQSNTESSS